MFLKMENMTKIRKFPLVWDVVAMLLIFFGSQLVVGVVLQFCGVVAPATSAIDTVPIDSYLAEQESLARYTALLYPLTMLIPTVLMWVYACWRGGKKAISIGSSAAGLNPSVVLVGVVWLLSAQVVIEPLALMLPKVEAPGVGLGVWAYITTIVSAPIIEELMCRGVILETIRKRWGIGLAIVVSALFFGLIHVAPATILVATVAGLIFGVLYVRTSSIFTSMIVHAVNNAIAFTLVVLEKDEVPLRTMIGNDTIYYIVYAVAAVLFVAATVEACFKLKSLKEEAEKKAVEEADSVEVADSAEVADEKVGEVEAES